MVDIQTYRQMQADAMGEKDFQWNVTLLCRAFHLEHYHAHDSRRSEPGFPDSVICGPGGVIFRELKRQDGHLSAPQQRWLDALTQAGADAAVWRPSQLLDGFIEDVLRGLT